MHSRHCRRGSCCYSLFLSVACFLGPFLLLQKGVQSKYVHRYPFLYAKENDSNASFPVIEHLSHAYRPNNNNDDDDNDEYEDQPAFLYAPQGQGYRIVEYYIHWCNTCRDFAPVFHKFSEKVTELAALQGISNMAIYAVNCSPNRRLCIAQQARDYPRIRLYKPNTLEYQEIAHHTHLNPYSVLETLGINFDEEEETARDQWTAETERRLAANGTSLLVAEWWQWWQEVVLGELPPSPFLPRSRDDLKADIHLSIDYAFRHEIFDTTDALTQIKSRVFRQWLDLLLLALPSPWKDMRALVQEIVNNYAYVARSYDYLVAVLDEYPPPTTQWSVSCSKGIPDQGYTCGLWELFHVVTVGAVDHNKASFTPSTLVSTRHVAISIRDYVDHFFGCATCRTHFVTAFDQQCSTTENSTTDGCGLSSEMTTTNATEWNALVVWLVRTHNAVNERLLQERVARGKPNLATVQWPSRRDCSLCWEQDEPTPDLITYMRHEYGQRDAVTTALQRQLALLEAERNKSVWSKLQEHAIVVQVKEQFLQSSNHSGWTMVALCVVSFLLGQFVTLYRSGSSAKKKTE